jgi:hypothetical protein
MLACAQLQCRTHALSRVGRPTQQLHSIADLGWPFEQYEHYCVPTIRLHSASKLPLNIATVLFSPFHRTLVIDLAQYSV